MVSWDFQRGTSGGTSEGTSETPAAHLRLGQRVIGDAMGQVGDCRCPVVRVVRCRQMPMSTMVSRKSRGR